MVNIPSLLHFTATHAIPWGKQKATGSARGPLLAGVAVAVQPALLPPVPCAPVIAHRGSAKGAVRGSTRACRLASTITRLLTAVRLPYRTTIILPTAKR